MRPKGKLLALIVMFAAIGLITATGAFTTVEAERTAEVDVAGDSAALLGLQAEDSAFIDQDGTGGEMVIDLDAGNTGDASGVNSNAATKVDELFTVTNQGQSDGVAVEIEVNGGANDLSDNVYFFVHESDLDSPSGSTLNDVATGQFANADEYVIVDASVALDAGDGVMVGMYIDLLGQTLEDDEEIMSSITITAEEGGSADYTASST